MKKLPLPLETMKTAWEKFKRGDHLEDLELRAMIKETEAAMPYLTARLPEFHLAWEKSVHDLITLKGYYEARKRKD